MVFRPDRLITAMNQFVCHALEISSLMVQSSLLETVYKKETTNSSPILFVTTAGVDPTDDLRKLAKIVIIYFIFLF